MIKQKDFKLHKGYNYYEKEGGYNYIVIKNNMDSQINLHGKKTTNQDFLVLKYEGASLIKTEWNFIVLPNRYVL